MMDYRIDDYKSLIVWKKAMQLAKETYVLLQKLPKDERYALTDQIRRSAISVPSNIAEGYGRTGRKEYARFLSIARGSSYELETQLLLCVELGYFQRNDLKTVFELINDIAKILTRILQKLGNG